MMVPYDILFMYMYTMDKIGEIGEISKLEMVGYVAVFLSIVSFLPVVRNIYRTKKTNNFPYKTILMALLAHACWFVYGLYSNTSATEYSGVLFILMYLFIFYIKMKH